MKYIVTVTANGECSQMGFNGDPELEQLQALVGGYIEMAHTHIPNVVMLINEEAKLECLPENAIATKAYKYGEHDSIRGNVAFMLLDEDSLRGFTSLEALWIQTMLGYMV